MRIGHRAPCSCAARIRHPVQPPLAPLFDEGGFGDCGPGAPGRMGIPAPRRTGWFGTDGETGRCAREALRVPWCITVRVRVSFHPLDWPAGGNLADAAVSKAAAARRAGSSPARATLSPSLTGQSQALLSRGLQVPRPAGAGQGGRVLPGAHHGDGRSMAERWSVDPEVRVRVPSVTLAGRWCTLANTAVFHAATRGSTPRRPTGQETQLVDSPTRCRG
jgi:hypothetical protein